MNETDAAETRAAVGGSRLKRFVMRGLARDDDALDEARAERLCSLGVGCGTAGVCYAAAHGQPEQCGRK